MKKTGITMLALALLSMSLCSLKCERDYAAKETNHKDDSLKKRLAQLESWNKKISAQNDSLTSFGFYLSQDYLAVKTRLSKYEKIPAEELLIDRLNDLMFSGGDHARNINNMEDLGEIGAFFNQTKTELNKLGVKYKWDPKKVRYALIKL